MLDKFSGLTKILLAIHFLNRIAPNHTNLLLPSYSYYTSHINIQIVPFKKQPNNNHALRYKNEIRSWSPNHPPPRPHPRHSRQGMSEVEGHIHRNSYYRLRAEFSLNVVVKWLTLLLRIREFLGSHLGPKTGYPKSGCSLFSSVPQGNFRDSNLRLGHDHFLPHPFQITIHLSAFHSPLYCLNYLESVVK
jgi:hypothetical protein